jgi:hypothetical protein
MILPELRNKYIVKEGKREREENKSMKDFIKEGERR